MNKVEIRPATIKKEAAFDDYKGQPSSASYRPHAANANERLAELEVENSRLQRLVSELLIKNQQLRKPD
jgi:hypothetical protein